VPNNNNDAQLNPTGRPPEARIRHADGKLEEVSVVSCEGLGVVTRVRTTLRNIKMYGGTLLLTALVLLLTNLGLTWRWKAEAQERTSAVLERLREQVQENARGVERTEIQSALKLEALLDKVTVLQTQVQKLDDKIDDRGP